MALAVGRQHRKKLKDLLNKKELIEFMQNQLRLTRKHRVEPETRLTPRHRQSVQTHPAQPAIYRESMADIESAMASLSLLVEQLDGVIGTSLTTQLRAATEPVFCLSCVRACVRACEVPVLVFGAESGLKVLGR